MFTIAAALNRVAKVAILSLNALNSSSWNQESDYELLSSLFD